jgi:hypothetical protein
MEGPGAAAARRRRAPRARLSGPLGATSLYTVSAIVMTWPLATALPSAIPWDLGDPLLNSWIVAWSADHLWRFLAGDLHAFDGYWHANIFHPAPYALAYSEHLFAQALQILPVWALTKNPVLCYNLLFLSTFVLSGLGMYLLTRELTGDARVAVVAGLCYGFAPYRISQYSHLQVLSSQWMPFALYGLKRYLDTGRARALAGGAAALVAQALSCGYYLVFFTPVALAYVAFGILTRPRARTIRVLGQITLAAIVVVAMTWPFVRPYLALRTLGFPQRPLAEVAAYSADTQSYLTAYESQWVWGSRLRRYPKAEGELFPGLVVILLAMTGVAADGRARWKAAADGGAPAWRRVVASVAAFAAVAGVAVVIALLVTGRISVRMGEAQIRATSLSGAVARMMAAVAVLLAMSRRARTAAKEWLRSDLAWYALLFVAAAVLSCGPTLRSGGRVLDDPAPYAWLYHHVPGFDGLRVPARFGMVATLSLCVLGGGGLHSLTRRTRHPGPWLAAAALLVLAEGGVAPLPLNATEAPNVYAEPDRRLYIDGRPPAVYEALRALPPDAVVLELPLGFARWDVRAVFYSTVHWRRLVNGYSGGTPQQYATTSAALSRLETEPSVAWSGLRATGATHVVVHRGAYLNGRAAAVVQWLENAGATRIGDYGTDRLFRVGH